MPYNFFFFFFFFFFFLSFNYFIVFNCFFLITQNTPFIIYTFTTSTHMLYITKILVLHIFFI